MYMKYNFIIFLSKLSAFILKRHSEMSIWTEMFRLCICDVICENLSHVAKGGTAK